MDFLLFIAPPAFGKTQWLKTYINSSGYYVLIVPLRALAEELIKNQWQTIHYNCWDKDFRIDEFLTKGGLLIVTPEKFLKLLNKDPRFDDLDFMVIWDEWHLNSIWGEAFRPMLLELQYYFWAHSCPQIGLTATLSLEDQQWLWELRYLLQIKIISYGNFELKKPPTSHQIILNNYSHWLELKILRLSLMKNTKVLIFVKYRQEVDRWVKLLQVKKIESLGCKGGETKEFIQRLVVQPQTKVIITTTALSHGVNLPSFTHICFTYVEDSPTFWLQMVARGGRRGEAYELVEMKKNTWKSSWVKTWAKSFFWAIVDLWLLKVLFCRRWIIKNVIWWLKCLPVKEQS
jgi:superfamily II DNA or RNA helicase